MKVLLLPLLFSVVMLFSCNDTTVDSQETSNTEATTEKAKKTGEDNVAFIWGEAALQGTAMDTERFKPRPTITSRYLGLIFTSIFDAWSRYDETAIPVYATTLERRPEEERTESNKEEAISYAAYRALCEYYYSDSTYFKEILTDLGYDPMNMSMDASTPAGIGNLAAKSVIEARKNDGANQYAMQEGSDGNSYYDYTGYQPINTADKNIDMNRWQPKYFSDGRGGAFAPGCLTPYWQHVEPIALDSSSEFRPGPPPVVGSEQLTEELKEVVAIQENMTDYDKALVEFMRDGTTIRSASWALAKICTIRFKT